MPGYSTEDCKALLAKDPMAVLHGAGDEKNWKRLSKKKNAAGNVERVFVHARGLYALVEEIAGSLVVAGFGKSEAELRQAAATAAAAAAGAQPAAVQGGAQGEGKYKLDGYTMVCVDKAASEKAMADVENSLAKGDYDDFGPLLKDNDPVALANCFIFAIAPDSQWGDDNSLDVVITPMDYWQETGYIDDQSMGGGVHALLPGYDFEELAESAFVLHSDVLRKEDILLDLLSKGFIWREECQRLVDRGSGQDGVGFVHRTASAMKEKDTLEKTVPPPNAPNPSRPKL